MKPALRLIAAIITCALAVGAAVVAWKMFAWAHFFATDAAYDVREMRGDGPQPPFWRDFLGYLVFYIPALMVALSSLLCGYLSFRSIRRGAGQSSLKHKAL